MPGGRNDGVLDWEADLLLTEFYNQNIVTHIMSHVQGGHKM